MDRIINYDYYYNNVPGKGLVRNNLVYTSLISDDQKVFVKWYHNDSGYHKGKNKVVDPALMEEKWLREVNYITQMRNVFPDLVPKIIKVDLAERKLYLEIDGPDFWQQANCQIENYDAVVPDWREQILNITKAHRSLGFYKYSVHPSSYFVVDGKLKSINYFFTLRQGEGPVTVNDFSSHLSDDRLEDAKVIAEQHNITFDTPLDLQTLQLLTFDSFKTNYPADFVEELKKIYA